MRPSSYGVGSSKNPHVGKSIRHSNSPGRDHQGDAFTMWMAGGGIMDVHGKTDEIGYTGIEGRVSVYDIQATILHLLGFNHE